jgi:hypothetical protein
MVIVGAWDMTRIIAPPGLTLNRIRRAAGSARPMRQTSSMVEQSL